MVFLSYNSKKTMFLFRNGLIEVPDKRQREVSILLTLEIAKSLAVLVTSGTRCAMF